MALQRNLKALGTFGYQTTGAAQSGVHPVHSAHAELRRARTCDRYPRFGRLAAICSTSRGRAAMTPFGISTHLFHGERLDRRASRSASRRHGFDLIEVFATRTHVDYRDRARGGRRSPAGSRDLGMSRGSIHAPICDGFRDGVWGRALLERLGQTRPPAGGDRRDAARRSTPRASSAAARWCCTSACRRGQPIPAGDNDPGAVRRSLEAIAEAVTARRACAWRSR